MADRVVVHKAERRLLLMRGERVLRTFDVALGLSPSGPKQQEGDFRTPEGNYRLSGRNANSDFFLAIQVAYPGPEDLRRASADGVAPGGLIMIHGQPNRPSQAARVLPDAGTGRTAASPSRTPTWWISG